MVLLADLTQDLISLLIMVKMRRHFRQSDHPLQVELLFVPVADQHVFNVGVFVVDAALGELLEFYVRVVGVAPFFADSRGADVRPFLRLLFRCLLWRS